MGKTPQWVDGRGVPVRGGGAPTSIAAARRIRQRAGSPALLAIGPALLAIGAALLLAACAPAPVRVPPGPQPTVAPPELVLPAEKSPAGDAAAADAAAADAAAKRMIVELVRAERLGASQRNAALLSSLWAEDARIVETRGTADTADDYTWQGRAAILDRYRVAVFPSPPAPPGETPLPEPAISGDGAVLVNGVDTWRFVLREERWWIAELVIDPVPGTP